MALVCDENRVLPLSCALAILSDHRPFVFPCLVSCVASYEDGLNGKRLPGHHLARLPVPRVENGWVGMEHCAYPMPNHLADAPIAVFFCKLMNDLQTRHRQHQHM